MKKIVQKLNSCSGYTLLEVAIVLVILSVVLLSAGTAYRIYVRQQIDEREIDMTLEIESAMSRFVYKKGRYPCPADASLARSATNYGVEDCRPNAAIPKLDGSGNLGTAAECTQPAGGLCNTASANASDSNIRRGMVPFITLEISEDKAYDPYGMRLTYMVSMRQTNATSYKKGNGTIRIRDIATVGGAENSLIDPPNKGEFVIFSAGKNRVGAFPRDAAGTPIAADGGQPHITTVPMPCTQANTGGAGEFANCSNLSEIVYTGSNGTSFLNRAANIPAWNTSPFLDDNVTYFTKTDATFWRESTANPADVILRDSTGKVAVGLGSGAAGEQLDLGLMVSATNPEAAIRSNAAVVSETDKFCNETSPGTNCFNPKNIAGDPDTGTGGLKCPPDEIVKEIYGDGTATKVVCVKANGEFCPPTKRLKGFDANGSPICATPGQTTCPGVSNKRLCDENDTNKIAQYMNYRISGPPARTAWLDSNSVGKNPYFSLPGGAANGTTITRSINTVIRKDANSSCAGLYSTGRIGFWHRWLNDWAPFGEGSRLCRYGFTSGERTETYTCNDGTWVQGETTGECTVEQCIMADYNEDIPCNRLAWTHTRYPSKVRLQDPFGAGPPYTADSRANFDSKNAWTGTYNVQGRSCGGIPPTDAPPSGNSLDNCRCENNIPSIPNWVPCDEGFKVDPTQVPMTDISADGKSFRQYTAFNCQGQNHGRWERPTPKKEDVCICDTNAYQLSFHSCQGGTVAVGSPEAPPFVRFKKTRNCTTTPPSWNEPGTPEGQCVCIPQIGTPTTYRVPCSQDFRSLEDSTLTIYTGQSGVWGEAVITRTADRDCVAGGPGFPNSLFYSADPNTRVLGSDQNIQYAVNTAGCVPINSTWIGNGASSSSGPGSPLERQTCWGPIERAACIGAGIPNCPPAETDRPCYLQDQGSSNWSRFDPCTCGQ